MQKKITAYIPEKLLKRVRERADREGRTLSAVVERALEAYTTKEKKRGNSGRDSRTAQ